MKKKISIVTACYNEEENVENLVCEVEKIFNTDETLKNYDFEHIFIDNGSFDKTASILKGLVKDHPQVKVIINSRNYGHIRSPYHGLIAAEGDAVMSLVADFQDPPTLIPDFVKKWEEGFEIVAGVKVQSDESSIFFAIRTIYYKLVSRLAEVELIDNFTGFGLYDKRIIQELRKISDPYPYFRGLICELGFSRTIIKYHQPVRKRGITKNNFYTLYDMAMLGITTNSKIPLRTATILGFLFSILSFSFAIAFFIAKLMFWDSFSMGLAPILIGVFFFSSVQMFFIGILGEYIGSIHTQVLNRPRVIELERINFNE